MLVTVIIPNYNHSLFLKQRIESVLNQTFQSFEIIILDDCSPDNSREILEQYRDNPKVSQVIFNEQNSGSTFKQWNKGMALAQGKYIWIAESDDFAHPFLLEKLVGILEANSEVGIAYCNSFMIDDQNNITSSTDIFYADLDPVLWQQDFILDGIDLVKKFMIYKNIIPNASAVLLRNKIVKEIGLADINYKVNGDWLYWASILAKTKVAFIAEPFNYFRQHNNNVRNSTVTNGIALLEQTQILKEIKKYGTPDPFFFDKMVRQLITMWFEAIIRYDLQLKLHYKIYNNLSKGDNLYNYRFQEESYKFLLTNNCTGLRRLIKVGIIYRIIRTIKHKIFQLK